MGGRMASRAQATAPLARTEGLVFFGFPLHPADKPGVTRAEHLEQVQVPMLFISGARDKLVTPALLAGVIAQHADRATLCELPHADHGFAVGKRVSEGKPPVIQVLAEVTTAWLAQLPARAP